MFSPKAGLLGMSGIRKSDLARNALMLHIHGRWLFERLIELKRWRLKRRQQIPDTRKFNLMTRQILHDSPRKAYIATFGKSVVELKVWMPRPLHNDACALAEASALTVGEYTMRALTVYYLGRAKYDSLKDEVGGEL